MMIGILEVIEKNVIFLDTATNHEHIQNLTNLAEKYVPIWKPLLEVVQTVDVETVDKMLPGAKINVNLLSGEEESTLCHPPKRCQNANVLYEILNSNQSKKLLLFNPKTSNYSSMDEVSDLLAKSINFKIIDQKIVLWRKEAAWDLEWLKSILRHLSEVMEEGGNLFDVASKIDFESISNAFGVPDLVDGVVRIVNGKTLDKLFEG